MKIQRFNESVGLTDDERRSKEQVKDKIHYYLMIEREDNNQDRRVFPYTNDKGLIHILEQYEYIKNEDWISDIYIVKETTKKELFFKDDIEKMTEWAAIKYNL